MVGHTGPYMTEEWGPEASLSGGHFQPAGAARSVCFIEKLAEENDIKDCTGKEFLKNKLPILKL